MKCEWKECTLGDLITFQRGHDLPKSIMAGFGYPVVGSNGIIGYHSEYTTDEPSISVGRSGNVGNPFIYYGKTWSHNTTLYIKEFKDTDPVFIYYFLKTLDLGTYAGGSAVPTLNRNHIHTLPVRVPIDIFTQKQIGEFLKSFDDKIELNERINKNLEQQAQALFKSWFVDFEPFGGVMPEGWKISTLGNVCLCELGGTPSRAKSEYWNGNIPWINSGEVNKFRIISPSETITDLGLSKSAAKLLPAKTTVIAITGATLGQVSLLEIESCANQSVVGVIPSKELPFEFIYPYIKEHIKELVSHQTGGAQQHINKQNVESLRVEIPSSDALKTYVGLVSGLYSSIANSCFENKCLAEVRDTLLPKLMSGEIDVSNVDI